MHWHLLNEIGFAWRGYFGAAQMILFNSVCFVVLVVVGALDVFDITFEAVYTIKP